MKLSDAVKTQWDRFAKGELNVDQYIKNINWLHAKVKGSVDNSYLKTIDMLKQADLI